MITAELTIPRLPAPPAPPHDPTSVLIDARTNWQLAESGGLTGLVWSSCDGWLSLDLQPDLKPSFADPAGTLGGLVLPPNVALADDGSVYLFDRATLTLKRFDPCTCRFDDVPGLVAAHGGDAREFRRATAIAICCGVLYVCDTGLDGRLAQGSSPHHNTLRTRLRHQNHRVSMFLLPAGQLRGHLRPRRTAFPQWRPVGVACDHRGDAWVLDQLNGVVHRFSASGHSTAVVTGLGRPERLAIDVHGRIVVLDRRLSDGSATLRVFTRTGTEVSAPTDVEAARPDFLPLPFPVLPGGLLDLRSICEDSCCRPDGGMFDPAGNPASPPAPASTPFLTSGTYLSQALDSRIQNCQWHRVILDSYLPTGTRIRVETFAADEEYDVNQIAGFATWTSREIAPRPDSSPAAVDDHDCLVPSPPGRYLWLRVTLIGNGRATPVVRAIEVEFPRLSSLRYLPAVFSAEPASADFTARFVSLFDTTLRRIERVVDTEPRLFDPAATPAVRVGRAPIDFLTWLASWIGVTFDRSWPEARRRRILASAARLFAWRGTVTGLRQQVLVWLGWLPPATCDCALRRRVCRCRPTNCGPADPVPAPLVPPLILEHFKLRRWLFLGTARVGAQAVLWGQQIVNRTQLNSNARADCTRLLATPDPRRDPLHFYAHGFTVFVPACAGATEAARRSFMNLLRAESPAHTKWDVAWVEPRFRIGVQSMIGFDSVVGGLPPTARLGTATLGGPTLVGPNRRAALRPGSSGRVGLGSELH